MRYIQTAALIVTGVLVGCFATIQWKGVQDFPVGSLLTAATTLIVALWIQRVIRFRTELDKVPFDIIGRLFDQIDSQLTEIAAAIKPEPTATEKQQVLTLLRNLSNEIIDFGPIVRVLDTATADYNDLQNASHALKTLLTDDEVQREPALRVMRRMKYINLALRWKLCQKILEHPNCFQDVIAAAANPSGVKR